MITSIHLICHTPWNSLNSSIPARLYVKSFTLAGRPENSVMQRTHQWVSAFQQDGQRVTGGFIALERGLVKHQVVVRMGDAE